LSTEGFLKADLSKLKRIEKIMSGDRAGPKISSGWGEVEKLSAAKYRLRLKPDLLEQFPVTRD